MSVFYASAHRGDATRLRLVVFKEIVRRMAMTSQIQQDLL
jgi:hypothetical protein